MPLLVFSVTLLVSAFILFLVQPIIGKLILPKLGGTPQVWNTCMVFFQTLLLAGYAYTHTSSTRLPLRKQLIVHAVLLLLPFLILLPIPFNVENWVPPSGSNPIFQTLLLLLFIVGLPFFVVSTSAPLLQRWFAFTGHPAGKDPYFLYAASNLGSLASLLLYPFLFEPLMALKAQSWMWTVSYGVLVVAVFACIYMVWGKSGTLELETAGGKPASQPDAGAAAATAQETGIQKSQKITRPLPSGKEENIDIQRGGDEITGLRRLRWILLAAVPSSLMLGVTSHITVDLSPIPIFWLIPLSLYLITFILVFSKYPVVWTDKPHTTVLYLQPAAVALMLLVDWLGANSPSWLWGQVFFNLIGFFLTTLVCHGELAKDRPPARHLTEFYLMMSVGGMLGGMFNGLLAPIIPLPFIWEFPTAIIAGCLLRPKLSDGGLVDEYVAGMIEDGGAKGKAKAAGTKSSGDGGSSVSNVLDFVLPVAAILFMIILSLIMGGSRLTNPGLYIGTTFGLTLLIACLFYSRPLRFGLTVAGVIIYYGIATNESYAHGDRSYFGIIRVKTQASEGVPFNTLIHGHINHGMNFWKPGVDNIPRIENWDDLERKNWGNPEKDFSRLATTYYHRYGPVGVVMEPYNWSGTLQVETIEDGKKKVESRMDMWAWEQNTFYADMRICTSMVGQGALQIGVGALPMGALLEPWSEPPYATVGLGTGTMASYARPFQHCHFYEIDNQVRKLSQPSRGKQLYFTYLRDAVDRGANVQMFMGDAFQRMKLPYSPAYQETTAGHLVTGTQKDPSGGPNGFYKVMVLDAFSSDAIPAHLLTKEAFEIYFSKLTEDGILCVHTSNRYVDLPLVVADVANDLGFASLRGHDQAPGRGKGHFTSEYVMVARNSKYLRQLKPPLGYQQKLREHAKKHEANPAEYGPVDIREQYWTTPAVNGRYIWTLDHYNLLQVLK